MASSSCLIFCAEEKLFSKDITEWFGLDGAFKEHLVQPCSEQGELQPDQAAQSPVQQDPECFQGRGISILLLQISVPGRERE